MGHDRGGDIASAEHAGDFFDTLLGVQFFHVGNRALIAHLFFHREVGGAARGDLGQVGDADDLARAGEGVEFFSDRVPHLAADIGVDFVEHQHRDAIVRGKHRFGREHDAGNFSARRDVAQRLFLFAEIGGETKVDLIEAGRLRFGVRHLNTEHTVGEPEVAQMPGDFRRQFVRRLAALVAQFFSRRLHVLCRGDSFRFQPREGVAPVLQVEQPLARRRELGEGFADRAAVFAPQFLIRGQPLLQPLEAGRFGFDGFETAGHRGG